MKFEIKQKDGRYELYVNGVYHSTHDTALEAANAIEKIKKGGTISSVDEGMRLKDL